jgi:hypothetical protein
VTCYSGLSLHPQEEPGEPASDLELT